MCPNSDLAQKELIPGWREWEVERIGDIRLNTISDVGPVEDRNWYSGKRMLMLDKRLLLHSSNNAHYRASTKEHQSYISKRKLYVTAVKGTAARMSPLVSHVDSISLS